MRNEPKQTIYASGEVGLLQKAKGGASNSYAFFQIKRISRQKLY